MTCQSEARGFSQWQRADMSRLDAACRVGAGAGRAHLGACWALMLAMFCGDGKPGVDGGPDCRHGGRAVEYPRASALRWSVGLIFCALAVLTLALPAAPPGRFGLAGLLSLVGPGAAFHRGGGANEVICRAFCQRGSPGTSAASAKTRASAQQMEQIQQMQGSNYTMTHEHDHMPRADRWRQRRQRLLWAGLRLATEAMQAEPEKLLYTLRCTEGPELRRRIIWRRLTSIPRRRPIRRSSIARTWASVTSCTTSAGTPAARATPTRASHGGIWSCPGLRSSRIHIVDTGRSARTEAAQGHRAGRDQSQDQPDRAAHRPLPGRRRRS